MYKIVLSQKAKKQIDRIPDIFYRRIKKHIDELGSNPRPFGYVKLIGCTNAYRIRVGSFRILYTVEDDILTVFIIEIAHRKDIYRDI